MWFLFCVIILFYLFVQAFSIKIHFFKEKIEKKKQLECRYYIQKISEIKCILLIILQNRLSKAIFFCFQTLLLFCGLLGLFLINLKFWASILKRTECKFTRRFRFRKRLVPTCMNKAIPQFWLLITLGKSFCKRGFLLNTALVHVREWKASLTHYK